MLLLLVPSSAQAGGFTIPLIGARASTRLAYVARPDETSAIYHNPAGLALLSEYRLDISGTGILSHTKYLRCTEAFDINGIPGCYGGFENPATTVKWGGMPKGFGILPFMGVSARFGLKHWTFGLGGYSPHNATGSFPDCTRDSDGAPLDCSGAASRFDAIRGTVNTIYITPSAAYHPHPAIAMGVGISAVRAAIKLNRALWLGGPDGAAGAFWDGEGLVNLDASAWSAAFNFGAIWNIGHTFAPSNRYLTGLRVGIAYSSQTTFDFKGDIKITSVPIATFAQTCNVSGSSVKCPAKSRFTFPMNVRVGLDWEINPHWSVGADVMWQNYKAYKEIRVKFAEELRVELPGSDPVIINETVEPKNSRDVVSVMVGGQWNVPWVRGLEARLGLFYDQSPYPNRTYSLLNPDADKYGFTTGVSYRFPVGKAGRLITELEVAAGYGALFYKDRVVRNSIIRPSLCEPGDTDCLQDFPDAPFSANGDVRDKRVDIFLLQLSVRFRRPKRVSDKKVAPLPAFPAAAPKAARPRPIEKKPEARKPPPKTPEEKPEKPRPKAPEGKKPEPEKPGTKTPEEKKPVPRPAKPADQPRTPPAR
jgi:long-chain fatty acid transport protein